MMTAVLVYSHSAGHQPQLERQLKEQDIRVLHFIDPEFSWRRRMIANMEIAAQNPNDLLLFLDAWDTLMLGTKGEIESLHLEVGITFAAGKICWPHRDREKDYSKISPHERSPWRYINSNPMVGLGKNIYKALDWGWKRFPILKDSKLIQDHENVCERFLTDLYLSRARKKFNIKLDTECRLAQLYRKSLPGDLYLLGDRIVNVLHRTKPIFVHANGRTILPPELLDA